MSQTNDNRSPAKVYARQIPPSQYNDAAAKAYTENSVRELVKSKAYQSYQRHLDYKDYFIFLWFLSAIGITAVLYFHLFTFGNSGETIFSLANIESKTMNSPSLPTTAAVALIVSLYLFPCIVTKSYLNVFSESPETGKKTYSFFLLLSLLLVSYGGPELHHPPFVSTLPPLQWHLAVTGERSVCRLMSVAFTRALPLQGYFIAGYVVSRWYTSHWKRMWHVPLPLITVPLFVGVFGAFFWRVSTLSIPYFYTEAEGMTSVGAEVRRQLWSNPSEAWSTLSSTFLQVWESMKEEVQGYGGLDRSLLLSRIPAAALYGASFSLSLFLFVASLLFPIVDYLFGGLLRALPSNPSHWLVLLGASIGGLYVTLSANPEENLARYAPCFALLAFALLYNGFSLY